MRVMTVRVILVVVDESHEGNDVWNDDTDSMAEFVASVEMLGRPLPCAGVRGKCQKNAMAASWQVVGGVVAVGGAAMSHC